MTRIDMMPLTFWIKIALTIPVTVQNAGILEWVKILAAQVYSSWLNLSTYVPVGEAHDWLIVGY
jgi:hypothetical protein